MIHPLVGWQGTQFGDSNTASNITDFQWSIWMLEPPRYLGPSLQDYLNPVGKHFMKKWPAILWHIWSLGSLATLYGECSFLYQNFIMPPYGRLFGTIFTICLSANLLSYIHMLIYPDLYVKTTYLNFSQRLSTFINVYCCKGYFFM